jgi:hypothetical protein
MSVWPRISCYTGFRGCDAWHHCRWESEMFLINLVVIFG